MPSVTLLTHLVPVPHQIGTGSRLWDFGTSSTGESCLESLPASVSCLQSHSLLTLIDASVPLRLPITGSYMYLGANCNQDNRLRYGITTAGITSEQRCTSTTQLTTGVWYGRTPPRHANHSVLRLNPQTLVLVSLSAGTPSLCPTPRPCRLPRSTSTVPRMRGAGESASTPASWLPSPMPSSARVSSPPTRTCPPSSPASWSTPPP